MPKVKSKNPIFNAINNLRNILTLPLLVCIVLSMKFTHGKQFKIVNRDRAGLAPIPNGNLPTPEEAFHGFVGTIDAYRLAEIGRLDSFYVLRVNIFGRDTYIGVDKDHLIEV